MKKKIKKFFRSKSVEALATKTFLQGFLTNLCLMNITGLDTLKTVLISAIMGGISAVMNLLVIILGDDNNDNN